MSEPSTLAAALASVQAKLPVIAKSETAEVEGTTKAGRPFKYKYSYADLAAVSKAVLPLLGENGLSWLTKPTLNGDGKFVLAYKLMHASGEHEDGEYPLPAQGTPQDIGSAISYARRYALCSVTGVAPEADDDDGAAASRRRYDEPAQAEPELELATREQLANYHTLRSQIGGTLVDDRLRELWQLVGTEFKNDALTATHANELRALISEQRTKPESTEPGLTDPTRKRIFALFRALKWEDSEVQHTFAGATLREDKAPIESFKTLTEADGLKLAAALEGRKRAMGVKS